MNRAGQMEPNSRSGVIPTPSGVLPPSPVLGPWQKSGPASPPGGPFCVALVIDDLQIFGPLVAVSHFARVGQLSRHQEAIRRLTESALQDVGTNPRVRRAKAKENTSMKWEYKIVRADTVENFESSLNNLGSEGWEATSGAYAVGESKKGLLRTGNGPFYGGWRSNVGCPDEASYFRLVTGRRLAL